MATKDSDRQTAASIFDLKAEIDRLREGLRWIAAGKTGSYGHAEDFAKAILDGGPTKAASAAYPLEQRLRDRLTAAELAVARLRSPDDEEDYADMDLIDYYEGKRDALRELLDSDPEATQ